MGNVGVSEIESKVSVKAVHETSAYLLRLPTITLWIILPDTRLTARIDYNTTFTNSRTKEWYIQTKSMSGNKVNEWLKETQLLSEITKNEPQAAYSCWCQWL